MIRSLATSLDGQWAVARTGREVVLLAAGAGPAVGKLELDSDDVDLAMVGPPAVVVVITRGMAARDHSIASAGEAGTREAAATKVVLHQPPYLDALARVDLDAPMKLATIIGGRLAVVSTDGRQMAIIRAAARGLASHPIDRGSAIVEFAVGIERDQLLVGQHRKLEVWDAISGRPLRKLALELPPPPRTIGAAAGHIWVTRPGSDEVFIYRLSDGRPFRHYVGAPIDEVVAHPMSPLVVLVTARGLVRLHCFAHSLFTIDAPWQPPTGDASATPLAQLVAGDDISLLGFPGGADEPWRVAIGGAGAPAVVESAEVPEPSLVTAADKLRAMRGATSEPPPESPPVKGWGSVSSIHTGQMPSRQWRDALATFGQELARGGDGELPVIAVDTELGDLAHRLALPPQARRALIALYALYLVGEPELAIARLARALGDWTEALGQGELGALAMLRRKGGSVGLRRAVTELVDGAPPCAIRIVGGPPTTPRAGAFRISREGRSDAAIEAELATQLGRIAVVEGPLVTALVEARLRGATAVMMTAAGARPKPWLSGAGLELVLYGAASSWVADVPVL